MLDRIFRVVILFFAAFIVVGARAASFTASLDRDTITLGETATLSLSFEGGSPKNVPTPDVPGLRIVNSGTSQNVSFINGAMSSTVTVAFSVTPQREGEFELPALKADVNGQQLASQPLKLSVQKANATTTAAVNSGSEVAFMKLLLPQKKIYSGQTLAAQLQIYLRDDVQNYGQPQFTATPADGLTLGKSSGGGASRTQIGNRVYTVIPISIGLTATKNGNLSLGPFTANMVVVLPSQNGGDDPFAQMGIRSPFFNGEQKQVSLATEQINIQSLPLPTENVPANFNGALGDYTMTVNAGPTNITVGDPITVRVQIAGSGNLDSIKLPGQSGWDDFKLFPPTQKTDFSDQLGLQGTKTFEEIVMPQNSDVRALPEFSFSFFNPDDGKYHTLTQPPEQLVVRAGGSTPMPAIAANKNSTPENQAPREILPIKENLGMLETKATPLISQPVFLAVQTLPVLAFLAAFIWRKRTDNLANNPRLRRQRFVMQLIAGGLSDMNKFAAENKFEEFFAMLFRLLQEQLGERLDCPATSITEADVDKRLIYMGASPANLESIRELFQLCNQARYAPIQTRQELAAVAAKFKKIIGELQSLKT